MVNGKLFSRFGIKLRRKKKKVNGNRWAKLPRGPIFYLSPNVMRSDGKIVNFSLCSNK